MCVTSSFPSCAGRSAVDGCITLADAVFVFRGRLRSRVRRASAARGKWRRRRGCRAIPCRDLNHGIAIARVAPIAGCWSMAAPLMRYAREPYAAPRNSIERTIAAGIGSTVGLSLQHPKAISTGRPCRGSYRPHDERVARRRVQRLANRSERIEGVASSDERSLQFGGA